VSEAKRKAMQELGLLPADQPALAGTPPAKTRQQAMRELGFIKPEGPEIIYPDQIDDSESKRISTLDRALALNVGDPAGSFNKLKTKYGPEGLDFSQSTEGDIVFKSKDSPKWSRLDPGERDTSSITSLGGLAPNKMYTGDPIEFAQDVVDVAPDIVQGGLTSAAQGVGGLFGGLPGAAAMGGLAGTIGEGARQLLGKATGFRKEFDPAQIAKQAAIDATVPAVFGTGLSKNQIASAVTKPGLLASVKQAVTGKAAPDLGVEILNKSNQGLMQSKLPEALVPDAIKAVRDANQGLAPFIGAKTWASINRISPEIKTRAFSEIKPAALKLLEKAGIKYGVGVGAPKTLADASPFVSTQGKAGEMVRIIQAEAEEARDKLLRKTGDEIEDALSKTTKKIDMSDERAMFDKAIRDLENEKARDPMQATQADATIAAIKKARMKVFGEMDSSPTRDALGTPVTPAPGKSAELDADVAWRKFMTLKKMAKYKSGDPDTDLVNSEVINLATRAERSFSDKMYEKINDIAGKDLKKQYRVFVRGDEDTKKLITSVDKGLSTAGKAFTDKGSHIYNDLKEYDDLYGTNVLDQLEVLSVARDFGTKGDWFPVSANGATSTGIGAQGSNIFRNAATTLADMVGAGGKVKSIMEGSGQIAGGMAGSSAVTRKAAKLGNLLDKVYGKAGGNWNPVSTPTMIASPWMNLDNTDQRQNRDLLRERYNP